MSLWPASFEATPGFLAQRRALGARSVSKHHHVNVIYQTLLEVVLDSKTLQLMYATPFASGHFFVRLHGARSICSDYMSDGG
jgi:hypothetical protein